MKTLIEGKCVNRWPTMEPTEDARAMTPEQVDAAKQLCLDCPMIDACRAYARAVKPVCGVWAGEEWEPARVPPGSDSRDLQIGRPKVMTT